MAQALTIKDIRNAAKRLAGHIHRTDLEKNATFTAMAGRDVYLKLENRQKTGSFKVRGALNKIKGLPAEEAKNGVITASGGNHAQAVAFAAQAVGVKATVVMPEETPVARVLATESYGAEVVLHGTTQAEAFEEAERLRKFSKAVYVEAADDLEVIAGQGTVGLEILEQNPDIEAIVVPAGGGALLAGIALAVKSVKPEVKVYGVQSSGAPALYMGKYAGKWVSTPEANTIADAIAVREPGRLTYEIIKKYVDDIVLVKDDDIAATVLQLIERSKLVAEGAGAASLTAVLQGLIPENGSVAAVISGGNIDVTLVSKLIEYGLIKTGRRVKFMTQLTDRPGELLTLSTHIKNHRGNIVFVHHEHAGRNLPIGHTQIEMDLETENQAHADEIISALRRAGYKVELM